MSCIVSPTSNAAVLKVSILRVMQRFTSAQQNGGGWLLLVFHHISEDTNLGYSVTPAEFEELVEWLAGERGGLVEIKTVRDVMSN
jgi:hypothetical protein